MKPIITLLLVLLALNAGAQEIFGKIVNENGDPVIIGAVLVKQNGVLKDGACSDYDGFYLVKSLAPGYYDVTVFYGCYDTITMTKVLVGSTGRTTANFNLTQSAGVPKHIVQPYKKLITENSNNPQQNESLTMILPCIYQKGPHTSWIAGCNMPSNMLYIVDGVQIPTLEIPDYPQPERYMPHTTPFRFTFEEMNHIAATDLRDAVAASPLVYQHQRGTDVNIAGGGPCGTLYVVDGVQMAR